MPISQSDLLEASKATVVAKADNLVEARRMGLKSAFLCHSHIDSKLAAGLSNMLRREGWNIYIDWQDASMPSKPNRTTALKIKAKIEISDYFLFLATDNSMKSRWCPWEIGFADGKKKFNDIFIVPTSSSISTYGSEYLQLYRRIDFSKQGNIAAWVPGSSAGIRVANL